MLIIGKADSFYFHFCFFPQFYLVHFPTIFRINSYDTDTKEQVKIKLDLAKQTNSLQNYFEAEVYQQIYREENFNKVEK